jgi:glycosyltransferase involved in cell wall biosynthesis
VALVASELTGHPFSFTAHAWDVSMIRTFLREKVERARFVVTCTGENQRDLAGLPRPGKSARVFLNHHGVTLAHFTPPAERPSDGVPRILACGALFERKGFADLVRACAILATDGVPFQCTIVGEGPQRGKLEAMIAASGLGDRVRLAGAMAHDDVIRRYADADIFVLPCLARAVSVIDDEADILKGLEAWFEGKASVIKDGIPNVLVEAMAMAVPVVSTLTAGIPELIEHEENGLLVPAREPRELAGAIRRLAENPQLRRTLGLRGVETVRARFDRGRTVSELADIFAAELDAMPRPERRLSGAVAEATR